jgi:hypothetical protein
MQKHAHKGALLLTLVLLGSCASSTTVPDATQMYSDAHTARLEAIRQLGKSDDPAASAALVAALDEPSESAAEREGTWLAVARALEQQAEKGRVGEEVLPVLDQLAARTFGAASPDGGAPRVPFDRAAADAARTIREKGARRSGGDGSSGRTQAQFLAELAWIQRVDEDETVHVSALKKLRKLGAEGVAPSAELVGRVRAQSRGDMVAYFVEMHAETGHEKCVPALARLACARHEEAWRPALVALRESGDARASRKLIEWLEADGVADTPRTHLVLAALGGIGSEQSVPFLVGLFGHESREVARAASYALVDAGAASVPALMDQLSNIDLQNRLMAALALSSLGDRQGREAARRFLGAVHSDDEETLKEIQRNLMR